MREAASRIERLRPIRSQANVVAGSTVSTARRRRLLLRSDLAAIREGDDVGTERVARVTANQDCGVARSRSGVVRCVVVRPKRPWLIQVARREKSRDFGSYKMPAASGTTTHDFFTFAWRGKCAHTACDDFIAI
jgi:hypothetical protein